MVALGLVAVVGLACIVVVVGVVVALVVRLVRRDRD
ncbi:MAG: hypothetical protein QOK05_3126 [Chloroflexota bacterium]|jgi:hypothetical protein|nr:hypothetical protein [Chloroflexota bacterium]